MLIFVLIMFGLSGIFPPKFFYVRFRHHHGIAYEVANVTLPPVHFATVPGVAAEPTAFTAVVALLPPNTPFHVIGGPIKPGLIFVGNNGHGPQIIESDVDGADAVNFSSDYGYAFAALFVGVGERRLRPIFRADPDPDNCVLLLAAFAYVGGPRLAYNLTKSYRTQLPTIIDALAGLPKPAGVLLLGEHPLNADFAPEFLSNGSFALTVHVNRNAVPGSHALLPWSIPPLPFAPYVANALLDSGHVGLYGDALAPIVPTDDIPDDVAGPALVQLPAIAF